MVVKLLNLHLFEIVRQKKKKKKNQQQQQNKTYGPIGEQVSSKYCYRLNNTCADSRTGFLKWWHKCKHVALQSFSKTKTKTKQNKKDKREFWHFWHNVVLRLI